MDTRASHIEVLSDVGSHGRDRISDLVLEVLCNIGNGGGIHSVQRSAESGVLKDHRLKGHVTRSLAYAKQRAVNGASAVEPGCGGVGHRLIKVVMSVPLKHLALNVGVVLKSVDDAGDASGKCHLGIRNAVSHRVAGADLNGDARIAGHLHQLVDKRNDEAVEIGSRNILKVTTGHNSRLKCIGHRFKIVIHTLPSGHLHLLEYVVITAADEYSGLADTEVTDQLEILAARSDPGGYLGKAQAEVAAFLKRLSVLFAVYEKFCLSDNAVGTAKP